MRSTALQGRGRADARLVKAIFKDPNSPLKRAFDIVAALTMIVLFAPLMALIAGLIAAHHGGGVIYAHRRVGRGGRTFRCLKFRTMVRNSEDILARLLADCPASREEWLRSRKLRDDPRIIPGVGELLRRSSLDELPQLFNVLWGDMSVVGPRPVVEDELQRYGPWTRHYLSVRPGLTGPWQIGGRSDETYETRVRYDVRYVEDWRFLTDVTITAQTARMILTGRSAGAY